MAVREVLLYPHPALKATAAPLAPADRPDAERVAADLVDTLRAVGHATGLAAPQLGELVRLVAVDVSGHRKTTTSHGLVVLANPRVVHGEGRERVIEADGFEARAIQHEIDHLDGLLFLDRLVTSDRVFRRKVYR